MPLNCVIVGLYCKYVYGQFYGKVYGKSSACAYDWYAHTNSGIIKYRQLTSEARLAPCDILLDTDHSKDDSFLVAWFAYMLLVNNASRDGSGAECWCGKYWCRSRSAKLFSLKLVVIGG